MVATTTGITSNSTNGLLENNFINSIKSEATKRLYIYCLNRYMQYYHFDNIDDLIFSCKQKEPKIIEANIIQYITWLRQDQKLASASVGAYLAAVMHFYSIDLLHN